MFENLLEKAIRKVETVREMINTNERLRAIVSGNNALLNDRLRAVVSENNALLKELLKENDDFLKLIQGVPSEIEWKSYDHCAAVTQLYAIYEHFVEDLISEWLQLLPKLVFPYSKLDNKIKKTHREGIGQLLIDLDKERFKDRLPISTLIKGLLSITNDHKKYELLPEAFVFHEKNLRRDTLSELLAKAGIENAWEWIIKHRQILYFLKEVKGYEVDLEKEKNLSKLVEEELKQFIEYRNDAGHGSISVDNILATKKLLDLCDFVEALCQSLAELVTYQILLKKSSIGQAQEVGKVDSWLDQIKVASVILEDLENTTCLSIGKKVYLVKKTSSYCSLATIESMQINKKPKKRVKISSGSKVGLKFNIDAQEGLKLYVIN